MSLRPRLVVALVATSALTLGVTAFALLSPLEHQLRKDKLETLRSQARSEAGFLLALDHGELPTAPHVRARMRDIAREVDAVAVLIDAAGRVRAGGDFDPGERGVVGLEAIRRGRTAERIFGTDGHQQARAAVPSPARLWALELRTTLEDVMAAGAVVRRAMLTAGIIGLAVALVVGFGLADRLGRRLRGLRETALRVAQLGPVVDIPPDPGGDEVAELTRAFSVMQQRLREQEDARKTFVATASHELRTPLTSLRLMLDLLREELAQDGVELAGPRDQLERAARMTGRLGALATQLLDLSRLDAGLPLRAEPIALSEECRAVIAEFADRAKEADRAVRLGGDRVVWALGDPSAVAQILRVLIDNALQFAPAGQPIEVEPVAADDEVLLRVRDHGPGVHEDERERIFERFERGSDTAGESGFGLGLAIARELADRMGGALTLAATLNGHGACFELRLTAAPNTPGGA